MGKIKSHNLKSKYEGTIILRVTHWLDLVYIPIKFHEDIPNDNGVIGCTRMKITQISKKESKGHNSEMYSNHNCMQHFVLS